MSQVGLFFVFNRFLRMKYKIYERMEKMNESTNHEAIKAPRMLTIRETARTGILPEKALRQMVKTGTCPHIMVGTKALVNYDRLVQMLEEC